MARVLVVDDDVTVREVVVSYLRAGGHAVVEAALDILHRESRTASLLRIADIGTGSGAILLALLSELPAATGIGTDINPAALDTAKTNATRLGFAGRASFIACDYAEDLSGPFDLIVSNPPYIRSADISALDPDVRDHDPALALDGGTDGDIHIVVHGSGVNQSILRQFVDSYLQFRSAWNTVLAENPAAAATLMAAQEPIKIADASPRGMATNSTLPYFYALIAMAALFGGFWGTRVVTDTQANQSDLGARLGVAPMHKLKALVAGLCAAVVVQFAALLILLGYLTFAMGVHLNAALPPLLLACLMGSAMGVTFGAFLSSLPIRKEGVKIAVLISVSLGLSFLAGMMVSGIKYTVIHALPIMAYINPANVLSDVFYALYAYQNHSRFLLNIGLLAAFAVAFSLVIYLLTRRQRYDSL